MLEAMVQPEKSFLTLTYDDKNLPRDSKGQATLDPEDLKLFLHRFRKRILPRKLRFYAVGEYGGQSLRPHYHLIAYGWPGCQRGQTTKTYNDDQPCCSSCQMLVETWGKGQVFQGTFTEQSAAYVAAYSCKKITGSMQGLYNGREPEFSRMSLKPGIGYNSMEAVATSLQTYNNLEHHHDVPTMLQHGTKQRPLGSYLRKRIKTLLGKPTHASEETMETLSFEMRTLRKAWENEGYPGTFTEYFKQLNEGGYQDQKARYEIFSTKEKI